MVSALVTLFASKGFPTVLSGLGGILGSALPELFGYWKDKQKTTQARADQVHELEILKLQAGMQQQGAQARLEEIRVQSAARQGELAAEAERLKAQLEASRQASEAEIARLGALAAAQERVEEAKQMSVRVAAQEAPSGVEWVDSVVRMVRPGITILFVLLYITVKVFMVLYVLRTAPNIANATVIADILNQIWRDEDAAAFTGILALWFGGRVFEKMRASQRR
ncbi:MAG TPA: hypothetical protein VF678_06600 [bacterium]